MDVSHVRSASSSLSKTGEARGCRVGPSLLCLVKGGNRVSLEAPTQDDGGGEVTVSREARVGQPVARCLCGPTPGSGLGYYGSRKGPLRDEPEFDVDESIREGFLCNRSRRGPTLGRVSEQGPRPAFEPAHRLPCELERGRSPLAARLAPAMPAALSGLSSFASERADS